MAPNFLKAFSFWGAVALAGVNAFLAFWPSLQGAVTPETYAAVNGFGATAIAVLRSINQNLSTEQ